MVNSKIGQFCVLLLLLFPTVTNAQKFGFDKVLKEAPDAPTVFCVPNSLQHEELLKNESIHVKFETDNWLFITTTPQWIYDHKQDGSLENFYFEFAPPTALGDTARFHHNVDDVHAGAAPLNTSYTGQDVIVGVVDQGIDWLHPDFLDANGDTRVLRYWDHSVNGNPPTGYGYGYEWDSTAINNGTCTSTEEASAHGSTVAGQALGNGNANGLNIGMAPDANIVIVETNFGLPNWTLTIADAVDYIFKIADEYNMPAVVNLSLGTYLGSHDGRDPASEMMEALIDEKPGRIVVGAMGNSGAQGYYHNQNANIGSDTSFVWFTNNPTSQVGANTVFFDLWSDSTDATYNFAMGANAPAPNYTFSGRTNFYDASVTGNNTYADTIWNGNNQIGTVEFYTEYIYGLFHLQAVVNVDSTDYLFRFETTGSGKYDLWSGEWLQLNDMVTNIPTVAELPDIVNYVMPDSLQTLVSSWNCSEKIVSVANMKNRWTFTDRNYVTYPVTGVDAQERSQNSSRGPSRHGVMKPDVIAAGDNSVTAAPLWVLQNPAYWSVVDSAGWHARNGGTSMASPVVAGIAALYLERCGMATYQNFIDDLHATSYTDQYTGTVPNFEYGFGKIDGLAMLSAQTLESTPTVSYIGSGLESSSSTNYQWFIDGVAVNGETNQTISYVSDGSYQVMTINDDGCFALSSPYQVSLSLAEIGIQKFKVYPNPTSESIQIQSDEEILDVQCYDLNGRTIELNLSGNKIDVTNMQSGSYILQITTVAGTASASFVKM
ncbi:MAG: S8 family serine peptidase [Fluviicola sp.]